MMAFLIFFNFCGSFGLQQKTQHGKWNNKRTYHLVDCYLQHYWYKIVWTKPHQFQCPSFTAKYSLIFVCFFYHLSCNPLCFRSIVQAKKIIHKLRLVGWNVLNYCDIHCRASLWAETAYHVHHSMPLSSCRHFYNKTLCMEVILPFLKKNIFRNVSRCGRHFFVDSKVSTSTFHFVDRDGSLLNVQWKRTHNFRYARILPHSLFSSTSLWKLASRSTLQRSLVKFPPRHCLIIELCVTLILICLNKNFCG